MVSIENLIKTNQILLQDELLPKSVGFDKTKTNFARKRVIITSILLLFFFGFRVLASFKNFGTNVSSVFIFFSLAKDFQLHCFHTVLSVVF